MRSRDDAEVSGSIGVLVSEKHNVWRFTVQISIKLSQRAMYLTTSPIPSAPSVSGYPQKQASEYPAPKPVSMTDEQLTNCQQTKGFTSFVVVQGHVFPSVFHLIIIS